MDTKKLILGLAIAALIVGILVAGFTPWGWFNRGASASISTPFGGFTVTEHQSSSWPLLGYALLGLGVIGLVVGFAMKSPPKA